MNDFMNKRIYSALIVLALVGGSMSGCRANKEANAPAGEPIADEPSKEDEQEVMDEDEEEITALEVKALSHPQFDIEYVKLTTDGLKPSVTSYVVADDFSNVINASDEIGGEYVRDEFRDKLLANYFVVAQENGREFFETYEFNAYSQTPNFVTVDSLMHSYHVYFAYLLKNTEKSYLYDSVKVMSDKLYEESIKNYEALKGSDFEEAAKTNVAYFAVAKAIFDGDSDIYDDVKEQVLYELSHIEEADEVTNSAVFKDMFEDYSQYKPRGYYDTDENLKKYFKAMMWYGRMTFAADDESLTKSAALMSAAIDNVAKDEWNAVYAVTSFFAGASDDLSICEYLPALYELYGDKLDVKEIAKGGAKWDSFMEYAKNLRAPQIQSIPVYEYEENVIPGFRMMGQRFTIDGSIMQNLIYRAVEENDKQERRMLPDVLDVPAALGSDAAKEITLSNGADKFPTYVARLEEQRKDINEAGDDIWNASLYSGWLNTLRPLLDKKGEGYPAFMQNDEWVKKTLETFAGSYTELKHDTVLYAKQPMAEMGGGYEEDIDDRGYVEPEPLVYERFYNLAIKTRDGLDSFGYISKEDKDNLTLLAQLSEKLVTIAEKELQNEVCTDEEYNLIRNYGGNIEHFWYEAMKGESKDEYFTSEEYPAALVIDVATDPNGQVLEAGVGNPREVYVIVPVDGILRIATGSVYNFYEFDWPLSDRLTDDKWREMVGAMPGEGFLYNRDESIVNPEWTMSYREDKYHWEEY